MGKSLKHAIEFAHRSEAKGSSRSMSQRERFIETARELGCDVDQEAFERVVRKMAKAEPVPSTKRGAGARGRER